MVIDYKKNKAWIENLAILMQVGLTMAGCIAFCFFVGYYIDRWLRTGGVFTAVFTVLGVVGGGVTVYRQIMDVIRKAPGEGAERNDR
jgi:F0F1-type ATP synthase assembly protein I